MLDFGFSEILLTSAIALIVLGPEKLPKVARQVGNWMGRARVMARQLSEQLEREVSAEEFLRSQPQVQTPTRGSPEVPPVIAPPSVSTPPPALESLPPETAALDASQTTAAAMHPAESAPTHASRAPEDPPAA